MNDRPTVPAARLRPPMGRPAWQRGWRSFVFGGVFLIYLVQTVSGIVIHTDGVATVVGLVLLVGFCAAYLLSMFAGRSGRYRRFWYLYALQAALVVAELPFAHQDALVMLTYLAVMTVAARYFKAIPIVAGFVVVALVLPVLIRPWHAGPQVGTALSIAIVSLAMLAFFGLIRSNEALEDARAEVARLAAEAERTRIARDLHDLLGHSLTTITVKAGLARRLTAVDPARAAAEIAEVEDLTRRTLADVRSAVAGYREVTLAGELAAAREVLRASGITASIPTAIDNVPAAQSELFAWVVREGVTNVVRHSRANHCELRLAEGSIEILDDGVGSAVDPGNGLTGLRERVDAAGGRLTVGARSARNGSADTGWRLLVELGR